MQSEHTFNYVKYLLTSHNNSTLHITLLIMIMLDFILFVSLKIIYERSNTSIPNLVLLVPIIINIVLYAMGKISLYDITVLFGVSMPILLIGVSIICLFLLLIAGFTKGFIDLYQIFKERKSKKYEKSDE